MRISQCPFEAGPGLRFSSCESLVTASIEVFRCCRYTAVQPQPESYGSVQLAMPLEPHQDVPTRPASERGPSRAHSPVKAANGNHAHRDHGAQQPSAALATLLTPC